jgi:hypothetical protein
MPSPSPEAMLVDLPGDLQDDPAMLLGDLLLPAPAVAMDEDVAGCKSAAPIVLSIEEVAESCGASEASASLPMTPMGTTALEANSGHKRRRQNVVSAPSEAFAIRQEPFFHRSTLRPYYEAQPISNVVLGLTRGTSGYARSAMMHGCAQVVDLPDGGAFFFMPNPKYHWSPEAVFNPERKVRFVAWWIHPDHCDELHAWVQQSKGESFPGLPAEVTPSKGVGAPGDFGYSGVPKTKGYLHTCRDLAGDESVRMLEALVAGIRSYIANVLGEDMLPGAHISAGFHYPVRPQYSTLHLQCRVNSGDVCPGEGRGVDLFRLLCRLREDPQVLSRDDETLFYEATANLRTSILKASEQVGAVVREVGPQSLIVGGSRDSQTCVR